VILEIPELVARLLPDRFGARPLHVACVRTTRAKFLVFDTDPDRPACVVQFGPGEELKRVHGILSRLHDKLPDVIPESLVCRPWRGADYVHIQAGLPGTPWFRLRDRIGGPREWDRLRDRASAVLARFHAAVREVPDWYARVRPGDELRGQAKVCRERGVNFSTQAGEHLDACAEALDALEELTWFAQHGDFCLNNLLVSASGLAIIDLDEFARTFVPLHDEIGLALSLQHLAPRGDRLLPPPEDLTAVLRSCRPEGVALFAHLPGLFLHHLLWRINQTHDCPTRAAARQEMVAMVEEFAARPDGVLPRSREVGPSLPLKPLTTGVR
jgi:hypothetical protein